MSGPLTDRPFGSFPELKADTVAFLKAAGFEYATPVQAAVLPLFAGNKDVVVDACTGSGKTLAFLLPVMEKLRKSRRPLAKTEVAFVVISPTRELSAQIFSVASPMFEKLTTLSLLKLVGGSDVTADLQAINVTGGNVIVATPGRLCDIIKKKTSLNFATVEVLVLDEADRLLDLGFEKQLLEIMRTLPKQRRTGLFSATQTGACEMLVKAGLRNPLRVNVTTTRRDNTERILDFGQKTPQSLSISAVVLPVDQKWHHFVEFLLNHGQEKIIVYGLTCACVEYWFYVLRKNPRLGGQAIRALHGKMAQSGREKAIRAFESDASGVLLATDVAARGLDIPEVQWVVQLDAPQDPNVFVHRVGRTARMGRRGEARVYLAPNEESYIKFLQLRKVPVKKVVEEAEVQDETEWLRKLSETEREAMLKGIAAYTSFVRAYGNHHCPYIFNLKELDLGKLAYLFGLLYLPGMKEIKAKGMVEFVPSRVDPRSVPFADRVREAERQRRLASLAEERQVQAEEKRPGKPQKKEKKTVDVETAKKSRNAKKRDLEELEVDYKIYRLEKKGMRGAVKELEETVSAELPLRGRPARPETAKEPEEMSRETHKRVATSKAARRKRLRTEEKTEREVLKKSLREKLTTLRLQRRAKGRLHKRT